MAITLEANYSKKVGLPSFSSHQYSLTVTTEINDVTKVESESNRLYSLLQNCVDRDIQETGFLPETPNGNGKPHSNGKTNGEHWNCSPKQRELIEKLVKDHRLNKNDIETLAQDRFSKGVKGLNRMEASGLIEELIEQHGSARK